MIITRTPFRISFVGGGTDLKSYYQTGYGAVVSATIDKYMYITVNKRFDDSIRVSYSSTEIVDRVEDIKHDIVREALKMVGIDHGIEITSVSDIPAGTGLGSSSSFAVGLLNALYTYIGQQRSAHELAEKACRLEIDILGHPIGKQDQFAAAYGGLNYFRFDKDGSVSYKPIKLSAADFAAMDSQLSMWYTGIRRSADSILKKQSEDTAKKLQVLHYMRTQADELYEELTQHGYSESFAAALRQGWEKKKSITGGISNAEIDRLYETAMRSGAKGGKILGAGGGGFLLFCCDSEKKAELAKNLGLQELHFHFTNHGSRVVFLSEN